ncbi:MAG: RtcB family protein, partial [Candidatus Pacebacteria bacterium]|nr:RtcB family protein [Candidatus Paceibacterota bacterium]
MINKDNFVKINDYLWEIPKSFRKEMKVPARIYASEKILENALCDRSISQLINTTTLPGIVKYSFAMPDIHEGYDFPIGGVAATEYPNGAISPGGIGFDQNCGMRILLSEHTEEDINPYLENLAKEIQKNVPSGLGKGQETKLSIEKIDRILKYGAKEIVEENYGKKEDLDNCESNGTLKEADPGAVSEHAKDRAKDQIGTLGSGNHFIEAQRVDKIFDKEIAKIFGLFKGQVVFMIHTGSRGLGHQIATDYINLMKKSILKYKINLPDRELASVPFSSPEGQRFFSAMSCGANYAWANRQMISYYIRKSARKILGEKIKLKLLYDVAHNIAKIEEHEIENETKKLIVHRKGATRAFPLKHPEIPEKYKNVGQPVLIPGSMGTASYILAGSDKGKESFYSTSHGSGRTMSRGAAIRTFSTKKILEEMTNKGIFVRFSSPRGLVEEAPGAYKNIDNVINIV